MYGNIRERKKTCNNEIYVPSRKYKENKKMMLDTRCIPIYSYMNEIENESYDHPLQFRITEHISFDFVTIKRFKRNHEEANMVKHNPS